MERGAPELRGTHGGTYTHLPRLTPVLDASGTFTVSPDQEHAGIKCLPGGRLLLHSVRVFSPSDFEQDDGAPRGRGNFGDVVTGILKVEPPEQVVLKTLRAPGCAPWRPVDVSLFIKEATHLFAASRHERIVKMLGVMIDEPTDGRRPTYGLVMERLVETAAARYERLGCAGSVIEILQVRARIDSPLKRNTSATSLFSRAKCRY